MPTPERTFSTKRQNGSTTGSEFARVIEALSRGSSLRRLSTLTLRNDSIVNPCQSKDDTVTSKDTRGPTGNAGAEFHEIGSAAANLLSELTQIAIFSKSIRRSAPAPIARTHA